MREKGKMFRACKMGALMLGLVIAGSMSADVVKVSAETKTFNITITNKLEFILIDHDT